MKKLLVAVGILCIAFTAFAQEESLAGKSIISGQFGLGFTYPGGKVPSDYSADTGTCYSFGVQYLYGLTDTGMIFGGLDYAYKPLVLKCEGDLYGYSYSITDKYNAAYYDINFGYRMYMGSLFVDLGGYYGIMSGDMKNKWSGDTSGSETVESKYTNNDYGIILGIGYNIAINEKVSIDLGARIKGGLSNVYDIDETDEEGSQFTMQLKNRTVSAQIGVNYAL